MNDWLFSRAMEEYCQTFDLTCRIPHSIIHGALQSGNLIYLNIDSTQSDSCPTKIIRRIEEYLHTEGQGSSIPLRICIPSLGSPQWGDLTPQVALKRLWQYTCSI
jgi:elongator complex protein 4